jgi:hypothetical protein
MLPAEFKHAIPASEWPQTHAFGLAATEIGAIMRIEKYNWNSDLVTANVGILLTARCERATDSNPVRSVSNTRLLSSRTALQIERLAINEAL